MTLVRSAIRGLLRRRRRAGGRAAGRAAPRRRLRGARGSRCATTTTRRRGRRWSTRWPGTPMRCWLRSTGRELARRLAQAAALLATVVGQDLDAGEDGVFRIARRVAAGPGDLHRGPAGAARPQDVSARLRRLQGARRDRPGLRDHHRHRGHPGQRRRRGSRRELLAGEDLYGASSACVRMAKPAESARRKREQPAREPMTDAPKKSSSSCMATPPMVGGEAPSTHSPPRGWR